MGTSFTSVSRSAPAPAPVATVRMETTRTCPIGHMMSLWSPRVCAPAHAAPNNLIMTSRAGGGHGKPFEYVLPPAAGEEGRRRRRSSLIIKRTT